MKKVNLFKLMLVAVAAFAMVFTGCDPEETPDPTDYFDVLSEYMVAQDMDLTDMTTEWIISADAVNTAGLTNFYIIDIRAADDYALGHIEGAVNTTLGNVLTTAQNANGTPILVVCYTGQAAAHALVALRLTGYADCKTLMFGMSSWNADFDSWTANTSNAIAADANWSQTNTIETPVTFSLPEFEANAETGAEILEERVAYMLSQGFKGVSAADVVATPSNYFINNYWTDADVNAYGHITGAYRIKEDLSIEAGGFANLDAASQVVTYCWTGQTSSLVTAYLTVLGYDALSLKFGANGMIYDELQAHKWSASGAYPYIVD